MPRIKAAVCHAFGDPLVIEEVDLAAPGTGEVEVSLGACAICHSDITYADGSWGGALPAIYGHEAAGEITGVGPGVSGDLFGNRVLVTLLRSCGTCRTCSAGAPAICGAAPATAPLTLPDGRTVLQAMHCGAFAEKVVVDQSQIAPIPEGIPYDVASLISCGVITGVGAVVNAAKLAPGEDVVVIGAGGVGLNAIQGARLAGASRIVAVDMREDKLDDAIEFGATHGILATEAAPWDNVRRLLGRGADAVFVTVGVPRAYDSAPRYLDRAGRVVMVGMPPTGALSSYEPDTMASLGQSLIGTKMGDTVLARDIPWLTEAYLQGRLKLDELISNRWRLDQINEAMENTRSGAARRNVIVF